MGLIEECAEELERLYAASRVYQVSTEIVGEPQASPVEKEISLIVKSVHEPSIDEIPLLGALLEAFDFSEIYEYERVVEAPGGSRAEHLARFLQEALSTGRAVIMVAPSLLGVSLAGRIPEELVEELDQGAMAQVSVRSDGLLYLPLKEAVDEQAIEVVGKSNSESSGERASWLIEEARRRGIRTRGPVFLPDNRAVAEYVTSIGSRGYLYRVPVTKLAAVLLAIDHCLDRDDLEEMRRPEVSSHTVYALRLSEGQLKSLTSTLIGLQGVRGSLLARLPQKLEPFFERGSRETVAEVLRKLAVL
jgi:hypothetical protein